MVPILAVQFPRALAFLPIISGLCGGAILVFILKEKIIFPRKALLALGAALLLIWSNILWTIDFDVSLKRAVKLSYLLPLYSVFLAVIYAGRRHVPKVFFNYMIVLCAVAAVFVSVDIALEAQVYRAIRGVTLEEMKSMAVFNRGAVVTTLLFVLCFMLMQNRNYKAILICLAPVLLMLMMIESQSAQLAFVLAVIFYMLFPSSKRWAWGALFGAIAIFMLSKPYLSNILNNNTLDAYYSLAVIKDAYLWHRFQIWDFVSQYAMQSPILGHGMEITKTLENDVAYNEGILLHPHSNVLQIWIEFGVVGVVATISGIGALINAIYKIDDAAVKRAAITSFIILFAIANFSYGMWQSWWLGLVAMIIGFNIMRMPFKN